MYRNQIDAFIDAHKEEMIEDLKTLVRINSQKGEAKEGMPFGEGPACVVAAAEEMMKKYGLSTTNYENYVVTGDFNEKEKALDILAHLDVVPVSEDWTVTQPFEPKIVGDRIYGRGVIDDKGPAVAALYALRAIKELGIDLKKNVRLILGSDEECGSSDLEYYYAKEEEAPATFSPDASFPLVNIEKGRLARKFARKVSSCEGLAAITAFHGGDKVNVVPAKAWAEVQGIDITVVNQAIAEDQSGVIFTATEENGKVKIAAKGVAAHASLPEGGKNGICALLTLLTRLPLSDTENLEAMKGILTLMPYGDVHGEAAGISMKDDISGELTLNLGILNFDGETWTGEFDSRVPICGNDETVTKVLASGFKAYGFEMEEGNMILPHHVPEESELVQKLLDSYERYTGKREKPIAMGGGTYVHDLKCGVAFGCEIDGVDNHMHGDDEFFDLDVFYLSAKIFADAILKICNE